MGFNLMFDVAFRFENFKLPQLRHLVISVYPVNVDRIFLFFAVFHFPDRFVFGY